MSTNIFGNAPNQVPTNADLGGMAYQDPRFVVIAGGNVNPTNFGTSNAQILAGNVTGIQNLAATAGNITTLVAANFSAANINMTGTTTTSGTVQITNATDSTGPNTGALRVTGGVGILANLHVGGNLFVTGNTFSLSTEDLRVEDSIIELHTFANLAPLTTNDGRDIGIKMHYYDVADNHAFLGRANDTGYLEWYAKGTEGVGNVFVGSNYGTIKAGELLAVNNTPSTSTTTGAVVVTGGVGISNGLYVNGLSYFQQLSSPNLYITTGATVTGKAVVADFSTPNLYVTTGATVTGKAVAGDLSTPNLYVTTGATITGQLVAANFSSPNVRVTNDVVTGTAHAASFDSPNVAIRGGYIGGGAGVTVANIYTSGVGNFGSAITPNLSVTTGATVSGAMVVSDFSAGNVLALNGAILHGGGFGGNGFTAGIGSLTGNLWIRGNVELTSGNTVVAPLRFRPSASGAVLSTLANGAVEYDGLTLTFVPDNRYGRGSIPVTVYTTGAGTSLTATTETTLQNFLPAANNLINLPVGSYYVRIVYAITRGATSTTAANYRIRLNAAAGTAVGTFHGVSHGAAGISTATFSNAHVGVALTNDMIVSASGATASIIYNGTVEGMLRITTAGSLIPQHSMSAALVGATTASVPSASNFIVIQQLSTSGSAAATGGWE